MPVLVSAFIWSVRVAWALYVASFGGPVAWAWMVSESLHAWYGLKNILFSQEWDRRPVGYLIPCAYVISYFVAPLGPVHQGALWSAVLIGLLICHGSLCAWMGTAYASGGPNYVRIITDGPFRWCRHPLVVLFVVQRMVFLLAYPCTWNAAVFAWSCLVAVIVSRVEESYLMRRAPEYRLYCQRVPWRFLPVGLVR